MADFLGSYYDSADIDGSELDERAMSQRMALLSIEQPVSVMEMDNLESVKGPARGRDLTALRQNVDQLKPTQRGDMFREKFSYDDGLGSGDDLDIPVASMSTFEQGQPSMVSVQLLSVKGEVLKRWQPPNEIKTAPPRTTDQYTGEEAVYSPMSDAYIGQSTVKRTRGTLQGRNQRKAVAFAEEEPAATALDDERSEDDKPGRKNSLFRFITRRHDNKVKSKRK